MISYKHFKNEDAKVGADVALKGKLYVSGWQLSRTLKKIRSGAIKDWSVSVAYENSTPVSVVINNKVGMTQAFTKKPYRRKGIASSLIKNCNINVVNYEEGIEGSFDFWKKVEKKDC